MITLNPQTQRLIEEQMKETGFATADDLVQLALRSLRDTRGEAFDELDPAIQTAVEDGLAEADRGDTQSWDIVRDELRARFVERR